MSIKKGDTSKNTTDRRNFLKFGIMAGGAAIASGSLIGCVTEDDGEESKVLTSDGKLASVPKSKVKAGSTVDITDAARKGIKGKKFVMVIDLSKCKNARKCQQACQKAHNLPEDDKWVKVYKMQDSKDASPYWMPKTCFHCEKPPCVKVCPVGATYKRDDGIVLIDNERCIGCRFCMAACPYSSRSFNWAAPSVAGDVEDSHCNPETSQPRKIGTVEKCDFCPDMLKQEKLPHCVTACPNGVFYFGDKNEDTVTNGDETVRFSELIRDKAGYRYLEELGTEPSVYYLPPVNRLFPFEEKPEEA